MNTPTLSPEMSSARPAMTAAIRAATGLDDAMLCALVHGFYTKVRVDPVLGSIFAARITDWKPHLEHMVSFWSSVALMTGRYHGRPVPAHTSLPINAAHFFPLAPAFSADGARGLYPRRSGPCRPSRRTHCTFASHRRSRGESRPRCSALTLLTKGYPDGRRASRP